MNILKCAEETLRPELTKDEVMLLVVGMVYMDKMLSRRQQTPEVSLARDKFLTLAIKLECFLQGTGSSV